MEFVSMLWEIFPQHEHPGVPKLTCGDTERRFAPFCLWLEPETS
jgi:hypothetical protein